MWQKIKSANARSGVMVLNSLLFSGLTWARRQAGEEQVSGVHSWAVLVH